MATKSFTTEFKFNQKSSHGLITAIENSKKVEHRLNQKVTKISDKERINNIMDSFFKKDN